MTIGPFVMVFWSVGLLITGIWFGALVESGYLAWSRRGVKFFRPRGGALPSEPPYRDDREAQAHRADVAERERDQAMREVARLQAPPPSAGGTLRQRLRTVAWAVGFGVALGGLMIATSNFMVRTAAHQESMAISRRIDHDSVDMGRLQMRLDRLDIMLELTRDALEPRIDPPRRWSCEPTLWYTPLHSPCAP